MKKQSKDLLSGFGLLLSTLAIYCPFKLFSGGLTIYGVDYLQLHRHRLRYAREAISHFHTLPGWYTAEFFGSPFWANLHNFPWAPNRLILLLTAPTLSYTVGVNLSAFLAAWFTFLYARSIGFSHLAAAVSGWTFSISGFFSSRIMAGQLPVLEAMCALPLLLWILERWAQKPHSSHIFLLAFAVFSIVLSGHPQLPAYSILIGCLYALYRRKDLPITIVFLTIGSGVLLSMFTWWPMLGLIGRSSRFLELSPASNDITFPYERLLSFIFPWRDGWPTVVLRTPQLPFTGYQTDAYFWDTVGYVGCLPWIATVVLVFSIFKKMKPKMPLPFMLILSAMALLSALPIRHLLTQFIPWTILRSPARQIYVTTFALSLFFGWLLNTLITLPKIKPYLKGTIVGVLILWHAIDLGQFSRQFIRLIPTEPLKTPVIEQIIAKEIKDYRVAIDYFLPLSFNRRFDDIGFYDSITLAQPYQSLLTLSNMDPKKNTEILSGSTLNKTLLAQMGVAFVVTPITRDDLLLRASSQGINLYSVPGPAPRVSFIPNQIGPHQIPQVDRFSPNEIEIKIANQSEGSLHLLESWDPGWSATINDISSAVVWGANDFSLAIPLKAGINTIKLSYHTPGKYMGAGLSLLGLIALFALWRQGRIAKTSI